MSGEAEKKVANQPRGDDERADWDRWADIPVAEVWEAVALSLDYEPDKLPGIDWHPISGDVFEDCPSEFRRRLAIAERNVESRALPTVSATKAYRTDRVLLAAFADWATSLRNPWKLSSSFPRDNSSHGIVEASGAALAMISKGGDWSAKPPKRSDQLAKVLYRILGDFQGRGMPVPTAAEVLSAIREQRPRGLTVGEDNTITYPSKGGNKVETLEKLRRRIDRMVDRR